MANGNILVFGEEGSWYKDQNKFVRYDVHSNAHSLMVLRQDELGITLPVNTLNLPNQKNIRVSISPNPTMDYLDIRFEGLFYGSISIIDLNGRVVRRQDVAPTDFVSLQTDMLPSGVYVVKYMSKSGNNVLSSSMFIKN